jgi:hypothetical protein
LPALTRAEAAAIAGIAAAAVVLHAHFAIVDVRPSPDLGHYWAGAMDVARSGRLDRADTAYGAAIGWMWRATDRSQGAFEAVEALWLASLVVGLGLAGRAAGGMRGLVTAASAALIFPAFPTGARTHWIHHPEAGAAALALGLAAGEATVGRGLALGVIAGLGATVRPSAAVWMLVPLALWAWRARGPARWLPLAPFAIGLLPILPSLPGYFRLRVEGRAGTAAAVGNPLPLLAIQTGLIPGLAAVVAAIAGGRPGPVGVAALAWVVGGIGVILVSGAGPDNVPTVLIGVAVLAATGAERIPARALAGILAALVLIGPATQLHRLDLGLVSGWPAEDHALNWLVPRAEGVTAEALARAADRACPPKGPCRLLVQRGLVHPSWEDDGSLAFFLAHADRVEPAAMPGWRHGTPDAAVSVTCEGPAPDPSARFPGIDERFVRAIAGMRPVGDVVGNGCVRVFYAPGP